MALSWEIQVLDPLTVLGWCAKGTAIAVWLVYPIRLPEKKLNCVALLLREVYRVARGNHFFKICLNSKNDSSLHRFTDTFDAGLLRPIARQGLVFPSNSIVLEVYLLPQHRLHCLSLFSGKSSFPVLTNCLWVDRDWTASRIWKPGEIEFRRAIQIFTVASDNSGKSWQKIPFVNDH